MEHQLRLIDLIPRRLSVIGLLLLVELGAVAALLALHAWMLDHAAANGRFAALDLGGERSLAAWFTALLLLAASLAALLVYSVRRYRTDDYQGHYRVWLWAAMCWFVLSTDKAAALHEGLQQLMIHLTGTKLYGDGAVWWIASYFFFLGAIGSRLLWDMRRCRLSSTALLIAAACYALAGADRLGWVLAASDPRAVMFKAGIEMAGGAMFLLAVGLYGRYVILDAEGLLPRRPPRGRLQPGDSSEEEEEDALLRAADDAWIDVDSPHGVPQPVWARDNAAALPVSVSAAPAGRVPVSPPAVATNAAPVSRKLTKGERKALRERLEQERLKRQAQQRGGWGK